MICFNHFFSLSPATDRMARARCNVWNSTLAASITKLCCRIGNYSRNITTNQYDSQRPLTHIKGSNLADTLWKSREDIPDAWEVTQFEDDGSHQRGDNYDAGRPGDRPGAHDRTMGRRHFGGGASGVVNPIEAIVRDIGEAGAPVVYVNHPTYGILPASTPYLARLAELVR